MPRQSLTKQELRHRWSHLRALMCDWDPIGVMDDPDCPRDEYDCLVGPLLTMLESNATVAEIATHLRTEVVEHFGLSPGHEDFTVVAGQVRSWYEHAWRDLLEPATIFVPMVGEGTDVWRPVRARPLREFGLFRIVGVEADVSDETWQYPAGAIVRCEHRRFADGEIRMTAVERAEEAG